jgi:hypothetical protein
VQEPARFPVERVQNPQKPARRRRRALLWTFFIALTALITLAVVATTLIPISSDTLRNRIVAFLSDKLDSDVQLGAISLRTWPTLHIDGSSLVIRDRGRAGDAPLIEVRTFAVDANALDLWRKHVTRVTLDGLTITIPAHRHGDDTDTTATAADTTEGPVRDAAHGGYVIDHLVSSDARLVIVPREREKTPRVWAIHRLQMQHVGVDESMPFQATLTNAIPPGEIETAGAFGPWKSKDPGRTPLHGTYTFNRADLSVFHGIAGVLSARGTFAHTLDHIDINGETETPDFTINVSGNPFPLNTTYHAIVDGTNGDTILERVDAQFLSSRLVAKGKVIDSPLKGRGRTVSLDVAMDKARLEDVLTMAVKASRPPMTGILKLHTTFLLPPGDTDVVDRLRLNGTFFMTDAHFTNINVQAKINELSHKGRGQAESENTASVVSNFKGEFSLGGGRLTLPSFAFSVPGAVVKLRGHYGLRAQTMDFKGDLLIDAKVSQTQTGLKSLLLKIVDPIFKRNGGGSALPIKITGKRNDPSFGLDMHRVFHKGP